MKALLLMAGVLLCNMACQNPVGDQPQPTREVIEKYLAQDVRVFGSYAVVKLPINSGVKVWNPVQIVRGPDDVLYAANIRAKYTPCTTPMEMGWKIMPSFSAT